MKLYSTLLFLSASRRKVRWGFLTYLYLIALLLATVLPINGSGVLNDSYTLNIRWDYLLHALVYIPLPLLMKTLVKNTGKAIFVSLPIAAGLELLQMFIPYRTFNINDLIANVAGVMTGCIVMILIKKKFA
ncbi:MAG: VanZ family protein [bacterium]